MLKKSTEQTKTVEHSSDKTSDSNSKASNKDVRIDKTVDSTEVTKAPKEASKSVGLQKSVLKTSYATSTAWVDSLGKLNHIIANLDSVTIKVKYIYKERIVHDSIYVSVKDSSSVNNSDTTISISKKVVEKFNWEVWGYRLIILLMVVIFILNKTGIWQKILPMALKLI